MPIHRSYSQITQYGECGHSYKLKRIDGIRERPAIWFAGGRAFHSVSEWFDGECFAGRDPVDVREDIPDAWYSVFGMELENLGPSTEMDAWRAAGRRTKEKPNKEDAEWWRTAGLDMCERYADWREVTKNSLRIATLPHGAPAIETAVDVSMGGVPSRGAVDRVFEDTVNGSLLLVDLKTGSRVPSTDMQLGDYAVKWFRKFGQRLWYGAYYMARSGRLTEPHELKWSPDLIDSMYQAADAGIRAGIFLPVLGSHCIGCGVRDHCDYVKAGMF